MNKEKIKYYTYSFDMVMLNILSIILFIIVSGVVFILEIKDNYVVDYSIIVLFLLMFGWLILHEILHGIGFSLFKEVDRSNITFGMFLEKGVFYCMCKQKIKKKIILTSLFFPVIIIGLFTLIWGMIINSFLLVYLSILNIVSSIGDIVMIVYFIKAPKDIVYLDLDDCTSFTVVSSRDINNIRVCGIRLVEVGDYDSSTMYSTDKRRLVISKGSYIFLIIVFILMIFSLVGGIL